jgi:prephenate dehydrogenase
MNKRLYDWHSAKSERKCQARSKTCFGSSVFALNVQNRALVVFSVPAPAAGQHVKSTGNHTGNHGYITNIAGEGVWNKLASFKANCLAAYLTMKY